MRMHCEMEAKQLNNHILDDDPVSAASGLTASDFRRVSANGLGEAYNAYPQAMVWFRDRLYVFVTRAVLAVRGVERQTRSPDLMAGIWPVRIPENLHDLDLRSRIWSYDPRSGEWNRIYISPMVAGSGGFDVPMCVGFRTISVFQGPGDSAPAIYAPTTATSYNPEIFMMRCFDGESFEIVSEPGLGIQPPTRALRGLISFKGRLFASPTASQQRFSYNYAPVMSILVTTDPCSSQWQPACEPFFGNPNNLSVFDMAVLSGHLYAGTTNIQEGYEIWKTDAQGIPPYRWKKVIGFGAYRGKLSQGAISLCAFGEHLYVGSAIQYGGYDVENNVGPAAPELIRIHSDDSWDLIAGDPRMTPEGLKVPLSGLGPGFGDPFAGYFWAMCTHEKWLYVGTLRWITQAKFSQREKWPDWAVRMLDEESLEKLLRRFGGFTLWRSRDGCRWLPVTLNGFGNYYNYGIRNMVSTPYGMFVGVANPYTPEVAVHRAAGWRYEENPKGGLEIWLGSIAHRSESGLKVKHEFSSDRPSAQKVSKRALPGGRWGLQELVREFYGGSDFRHMGYWFGGVDNARKACELLMDEILSQLPKYSEGSIADVGCGLGETTRYLLKWFPSKAITGITFTKEYLPACRMKAPKIQFLHRKRSRFGLRPGFFAHALWVKGFDPLLPRAGLLQEAFRLLKPGGLLVCFDVLRPNSGLQPRTGLFRRVQNHPGTVEDYRKLLLSTGFKEAMLVDVTDQTLRPFRKHRIRYFGMKRLSGEITEEMFEKVSEYFHNAETGVAGCLMISARKP
jgi:ubiquinone/menaquinone biosynthesis C-methylase UbiE